MAAVALYSITASLRFFTISLRLAFAFFRASP